MKEERFAEYIFVLIMGIAILILLIVGIFLICMVAVRKAKGVKTYCDQRFTMVSSEMDAKFKKVLLEIDGTNSAIQKLNANLEEYNSKN